MSDLHARMVSAEIALGYQDEGPTLALPAELRAGPDARVLATRRLSRAAVGGLQRIESRLGERPDHPELWLLAGATQMEAGYRARGSAPARLTTQNQIAWMQTLMDRGRVSLRRAAELLPDDPSPWVFLMTRAQFAGGCSPGPTTTRPRRRRTRCSRACSTSAARGGRPGRTWRAAGRWRRSRGATSATPTRCSPAFARMADALSAGGRFGWLTRCPPGFALVRADG